MTVTGVPIASLPNGVIFNNVQVENHGTIQNVAQPSADASVYLYVHVAGYEPTSSSTRAAVFSDEFLTVPLAQPLTTDANGSVPGYVAVGQLLDLVATIPGVPAELVLFVNTSGAASVSSLGGDVTGTPSATTVATVKGGKTPLTADQNLADVASPSAARSSLGLGSAATQPSSAFDATGSAGTEQTRATAAEATLTAALATEATTRATADTANTNAISAEATARATADAVNATAITSETARATTAENANTTAITAEATARAAADVLLIPLTQKAAANGVATLDGSGKVPAGQLTVDAMEYKGSWNASTNTPTLTNGTGSVGDFYIVSVGGSGGPVTAAAGDHVILNPSLVWEDIPVGGVGGVASFQTRTGAVVLTKADVTGTGLAAADIAALDTPAGMTAQDLIIAISGSVVGRIAVGASGQDMVVRSDGTVGWVDTPMANVKAWGAVGDGATDDTTPILAAIATGKSVLFPECSSFYKATGGLTYHSNTVWKFASRAVRLKLTTDLYSAGAAPAHFITPAGGTATYWKAVSGTIQGPGSYSLGQVTCRTTGVQLNSKCGVDDCLVQFFFAGVEHLNDHTFITGRSQLTNNYYGMDFPDGMAGFGNQNLFQVDLTGNNLASVHIGGSGQWDTSVAADVHMGLSPLGIYKTDNQSGWDGANNPVYAGTASSRSGVTGFDFTGVYFERVGNGCILDTSTGVSGNVTLGGGGRWRSTGHTWDTATYQSTLAPLNNAVVQGEWAIIARTIQAGTVFDCGEGPFVAGSVGVWNVASGGPTVILSAPPVATFVGSGATWSYSGGVLHVRVEGSSRGTWGDAFVYQATATVATGDLVELVPGQSGQVRRATGAEPLFGVALTPGVASGAIVVQTSGYAAVNCIGTDQITGAAALCMSPTTPYLADLASANPGNVPVGISLNQGANPTVSIGGVLLTPGLGASGRQIVAAGSMTGAIGETVAAGAAMWVYGTLTGNVALTATLGAGSAMKLLLLQDGTGGRTLSVNGTAVSINPVASSAIEVDVYSPDGVNTYVDVAGAPGVRGSIWFTGITAPGTLTGQQNNDWYLNTTNGNVYELLGGVWTLEGNITGPAGATGATGATGAMSGLFGDGSDGVVVLDGTTAFAGFSTLAGSTYTLTRDVEATALTINAGVTVTPAGFRIRVNGTFTNNNAIGGASGAGTALGVGGTALASAVVGGGVAGSAGNVGAGTAGVSGSYAASGAGGSGSGGAGGAAATATLSTTGRGQTVFKRTAVADAGSFNWAGTVKPILGGSSGGGGGGDGTNKGGGGGAGGQVIVIYAKTMVNNGTINANGGAGGSPATGNCGGGGGGAGGLILIYTTAAATGTGTATVTGGAAGTSVGTGGAAGAGSNGLYMNVVLSS